MRRAYLLAAVSTIALLGPLTHTGYTTILALIASDLRTPLQVLAASVTVYTLVMAAGRFLLGPAIDRLGPQRVLVAALLIYAGSSGAAAALPMVAGFLGSLGVQAVAVCGFSLLASVMVADLYDRAGRARAMSIYTLVTATVGPGAGPVLAATLGEMTGWRSFFWFLSGTAIVLTAAILPGLRQHRGHARGASAKTRGSWCFRPQLIALAVLSGLQFATQMLLVAWVPWVLREEWSGAAAGWVTGTLAIIAGLASPIGGLLADRLGRVATVRGAALTLMLSGAAGALAVSLAPSAALTWLPLIALLFTTLGLGLPAQLTLATEIRPEAKGSALGSFYLVRFGVGSLGPLLLPTVLALGPSAALWVSTSGGALAWLLSWFLSEPTVADTLVAS